MRNTFIEAGDDTFESMIASVDRGIYAKKMGGGSVQPGTGEFNFSVEAILSKTARSPPRSSLQLGQHRKQGAEGNQHGRRCLSLAAGMCGSVSGAGPTTVGHQA